MTVLLSDEKESSSPGKQAAIADEKQHAQPMITSKAEVKPAVRLPKTQEIAPKQNVAPLAPVRPQSDSDSGPASGLTGIETQHYYSSDVGGSSSSSVSSQSSRSGHGEGETGAASASRGQTGQTTDAGAPDSLKQRIRDALQANLVYPYIARKRRMEGTVLVDFKINHRGTAEKIRVLKGSGYALLDSAAMETVVKASPFPVADFSVEVPITYRLSQD